MPRGNRARLLQLVPGDESIKVSRLRIHNRSNRTRYLTLTAYVEWVSERRAE